MDVFSRASILPLQDVLELAPHPSSFNIKKDTKRLDKNDQMLVKWRQLRKSSDIKSGSRSDSWDGPGEADQSTGGSQLSKAGLAGATGVSQKPVGYLWVSVCHGLSSCKFGTTLCIPLWQHPTGFFWGSGVALPKFKSREWMRMLRLCRPNCSYSTGIHGEDLCIPAELACKVFRHGGLSTNWKRAGRQLTFI